MVSSQEIRKIILEESYRAGVGHIGSCLSIADILAVLYKSILHIPSPKSEERDRFILSKGHAALALYAVLYEKGFVSKSILKSFHTDGGHLGTHPEVGIPGVELATGSLGQGLSVGAGIALAAHIQSKKWQTYVLVSDAECNEGSIWEAAQFASQQKLSNLTCIVDLNGQQGFGYTKDVISTAKLASKWQAFDFCVEEVDGHDENALLKCLKNGKKNETRPRAILAHTTLGKGVSFMEGKVAWHYLPMTSVQYTQALEELGHHA